MSILAVTGLAFEARIAAGPGVRTLAGGGDRARLAAALDAEVTDETVGLLSFGIAGALDPAAVAGTWIVPDAVVTVNQRWPVDADWSEALRQRLPGAWRGAIAGADVIAAAADAKRALHAATGACALDMESHVVAAFAAQRGIPFAVFRAIADPAASALAPAAIVAMRPDGTVNQGVVWFSLLRAPRQLPTLMRNARDTRAATRALSRGRRLLGPGLGYPDFR
jgi:adenosylhomocysteine nucleosidase